MNRNCVFCQELVSPIAPLFFFEDASGLFVARWNMFPMRPGHALVMPKRHVQSFRDLADEELMHIARVVAEVKRHVAQADLAKVYEALAEHPVNGKSRHYIASAQAVLERHHNLPPDAFNDAINDGVAAGQTVPHVHWHILPRWAGDVVDPRGGVLHMFGPHGNYRHSFEENKK